MRWVLGDLPRLVTTIPFRVLPADLLVGRTVFQALRQIFLSGAIITGPFVVTVLVLGVILDFVVNLLTPFAQALTFLGLTGGQGGAVALGLTVVILLGVVFLAGVLAEVGSNTGLERGLGRAVKAVPGIGSVYSSFDRMRDVMLESDVQSFREVKLVEFPHAGVYSLAFQTSEVRDAASDGETMLVLFVPLAPNPVMGGFMVCVPARHVRDVDLTVQEAFQAIVTSGVAMTGSLPATAPDMGRSTRH